MRRMAYGILDEEGIEPLGIPLALAFPVVNALIVGNVVVMTNALAHMNAVTNVSGNSAVESNASQTPKSVILDNVYVEGEVYERLDEDGLSQCRQAVLIRKVIEQKGNSTETNSGEISFDYKGTVITVRYKDSDGIIRVESGVIRRD